MNTQRKVICCAARLRTADGIGEIVIIGVHPWDKWMRLHAQALAFAKTISTPFGLPWEHGFVDQRECFMTIEEATKVAIDAGQIAPRESGLLESTELY